MKKLVTGVLLAGVAATLAVGVAAPAQAQCRDSHGRFAKCYEADLPSVNVPSVNLPSLPDVNVHAAPAPAAAPAATPAPSNVDQLFITEVNSIGINYPDSGYAISHAHALCDFMAANQLYSGSSASGNYVANTTVWGNGGPAAQFAMYTANNYCIQQQSE